MALRRYFSASNREKYFCRNSVADYSFLISFFALSHSGFMGRFFTTQSYNGISQTEKAISQSCYCSPQPIVPSLVLSGNIGTVPANRNE
jgi:hypothetical protein